MSLASASLDAEAHGGAGAEWIVVPYIAMLLGFLMGGAIHLMYGRALILVRFLQALGWVAANVAITFAGAIVCGQVLIRIAGHGMSDLQLMSWIWSIPVIAWILPVVLFLRTRRGF